MNVLSSSRRSLLVGLLCLLLRVSLAVALSIPRDTKSTTSASSAAPKQQHQKQQHHDDGDDEDVYTPKLRAKVAHSIAKGERRASERDAQLRGVCEHCSRPPALCVCHVLPRQKYVTQTQVLILQHPNERRKRNLSTVPLLRLVLENVQVMVGYIFEAKSIPAVMEQLELGQKPLLLYPSPNAISLDAHDNSDIENAKRLEVLLPSSKQMSNNDQDDHNDHNHINNDNLLIIMDGTWTEAKRMVRDSPSLVECCQPVKFTADSSSIYHALRREPEDHCISTLEACARALALLEVHNDNNNNNSSNNNNAVDHLYKVLQAHVDAHLVNAKVMAPRCVGISAQKSNERKQRWQEIELDMFATATTNRQQQSENDSTASTASSVSYKIPTTSLKEGTSNGQILATLPDGAILRTLEECSDAPLADLSQENINSKSLEESEKDPQSANSSTTTTRDDGCSLGIEIDGQLVASIRQYEGGALGMLNVQANVRRRGYGRALLQQATRTLAERGGERVAFIVEGNLASEALFESVGWERADSSQKRQTGKRRAKVKWVHK